MYPTVAPQDFVSTQAYMRSSSITLEISECIIICSRFNQRYLHMHFDLSYNNLQCTCSNSYKNYSISAPDSFCNGPCSSFSQIGLLKCPSVKSYYSSFQIGL